MARPSKPTALLVLEGKARKTKAELEYRANGEKALRTGDLPRVTAQVKADPAAYAEFRRLRRLYAKIEFVDALDQQAINRYCMEVSNLSRMQQALNALIAGMEAEEDLIERARLAKKIIEGSVALRMHQELLIKYEDRLFLNPASRIRAVPKTPPKEKKREGIAAYMAQRAEV